MANLVYRDRIFDDLFDIRRDFDELFNRMLTNGHPGTSNRNLSGADQRSARESVSVPAIDAYVDRENKRFVCRVSLPGVDPKEVEIEVQGRVLSISAERTTKNESGEAEFVHREMTYGSIERDLLLPEGVDADKLTAHYENGILEIVAPVASAALPKRIEIQSGQSPKQVAAGSGR